MTFVDDKSLIKTTKSCSSQMYW